MASTEMGNFSTSQETISFSSTALIYGVQHLIHTFYSGDLHIPQCLVVLCGTSDRLQSQTNQHHIQSHCVTVNNGGNTINHTG